MSFYQDNKKIFYLSIFSSIIASIIFIVIIQPIVNNILNILANFSTTLFQKVSDTVYENAALGKRNWVSVVIFYIICAPILAIILFPLIYNYVVTTFGKDNDLKKNRAANIIISAFNVIFAICTFLSLLYIIISVRSDLQLNTSFEQRIVVLAPKLSDQEIKELKAKWALMKTRNGYEKINENLENLANKYKIILPKPLLK